MMGGSGICYDSIQFLLWNERRRRHSLLENCFGVVISLGWDYLMSCYLLAAAAWINVNMPGTDTGY